MTAPVALEEAASRVIAEVFDAALEALNVATDDALPEAVEALPPAARLVAGAEWMRRLIAARGCPSSHEERRWKAMLREHAEEAVAPWAAIEVFHHFPAESYLRFVTTLFDERAVAPLRQQLLTGRLSRTAALDSWLAEVAPALSVPTYGFGSDGTQTLAYGTRALRLILTSTNAILLEDAATGRRLRRLPRALSRDSPVEVAKAREHIKAIRAGVRESLRTLRQQLTDDMLIGHRWTGEEWRQLFLEHPLLQPLSRGLVFATERGTFFVTEEGEGLDLDLEPAPLGDDESVWIAHPHELSSEQRDRWQELFEDAEIAAPFPQLHRATPALPEDHPLLDLCALELSANTFCRSLRSAGFDFAPPTGRRLRVYSASRRYGRRLRVTFNHSGHFHNIFVLNERDRLRLEEVLLFGPHGEPLPITHAPDTLLMELRRLLLTSAIEPDSAPRRSAAAAVRRRSSSAA